MTKVGEKTLRLTASEVGEKEPEAPAPAEEVRVPPPSTCIETIDGERPIRLSFQIKVF